MHENIYLCLCSARTLTIVRHHTSAPADKWGMPTQTRKYMDFALLASIPVFFLVLVELKRRLVQKELHLWGVPVQLVHRRPSNISSRHSLRYVYWSPEGLLKSRVIRRVADLRPPEKSLWAKASCRELEPGDQNQSREDTDKNAGRWKRRMRIVSSSEGVRSEAETEWDYVEILLHFCTVIWLTGLDL